MTERLDFDFSLSCTGEGNGNPLQCSCLENPRDRGAWWIAVYGVAQSRTRLKWLSSSSRVSARPLSLPKKASCREKAQTFESISSCSCSVVKLCPTLCDPVDCSTPSLPPGVSQTHVHWVSDAIQPSHPLLPLLLLPSMLPSNPSFVISHQWLWQR